MTGRPTVEGRLVDLLAQWWAEKGADTAATAYLTGPASPLKADVLTAFVAAVTSRDPALAVIRIGGDPDPALFVRLAETLDRIIDGIPGDAPTLLVVDDLDELAGRRSAMSRQVLLASRTPDELLAVGIRLVAGARRPPASAGGTRIEVEYVYPRTGLTSRIREWATDRDGAGALLVTGPPGSGKTVLLHEAARLLRAEPGIVLAHQSIRDWSDGAAAVQTMGELFSDFVAALDGTGYDVARFVTSRLPGQRAVRVNQQVGVNYGSVTGAELVLSDAATQIVEAIIDLLVDRAAKGQASGTLLLVIDALDEWERRQPGWLAQLELLLSRRASFREWGLKLLLSAQYRPDWLSGSAHLDLAEIDTDDDVRGFAAARLAVTALPAQDQIAAAEDVRRLSGGLFIVAAGYLDELAGGQLTPGELADAAAPGSATSYFARALARLRDDLGGPRSQAWCDVERFLAILAVIPGGQSAADLARLWVVPAETGIELPTSTDWYHARDQVINGPARRYVAATDGAPPGFRLVHGSVREAVTQAPATHEQLSVAAERRRWLATCTPLLGPGRAWDPVHGRVALAEVAPVLADIIVEARAREPVDADSLEQGRALVRQLLEGWDWLEACITEANSHAPVPLGVGQVLHQLDRLIAVDPELGSTPLWPNGVLAPEPPAADPKPEPRSKTPTQTKRPRYPTIHTAVIREIISGRAWFPTREQSVARVKQIRTSYSVSRETHDLDNPDAIVIWIYGYDLSPADIAAREKGHYALLAPKQATDGWTIVASRAIVDRGSPNPSPPPGAASPNWSQWLLRRTANNPKHYAKEPKVFASRGLIRVEFDKLKRRFPDAVVDLEHNPQVHVYDRATGLVDGATGEELPITKVDLVIVAVSGGFVVEARVKGYLSKAKRFVPIVEAVPAAAPEEVT